MGSNPIPAILSLRSTILVVRRTVYPEVAGSYPVGVVFMGPKLNWGSACVDAGGWEFKSLRFHYAGMAQWQRSCFVNSRLPVQVWVAALRITLERFHGGFISREHGFKSHIRDFIAP